MPFTSRTVTGATQARRASEGTCRLRLVEHLQPFLERLTGSGIELRQTVANLGQQLLDLVLEAAHAVQVIGVRGREGRDGVQVAARRVDVRSEKIALVSLFVLEARDEGFKLLCGLLV